MLRNRFFLLCVKLPRQKIMFQTEVVIIIVVVVYIEEEEERKKVKSSNKRVKCFCRMNCTLQFRRRIINTWNHNYSIHQALVKPFYETIKTNSYTRFDEKDLFAALAVEEENEKIKWFVLRKRCRAITSSVTLWFWKWPSAKQSDRKVPIKRRKYQQKTLNHDKKKKNN